VSPLRPFKLSTDLRLCAEMLPAAFQYPENPAWSIQPDEEEGLVDMLNRLARIWPLIRFLQFIFPSLRDYVRGYVWEEAGQPIGIILLHRRGRTDTWHIARAAVLPGYRRQGIGRSLVQAGLDYIRDRGGKTVLLGVVTGNLPARRLYEQVGFETFRRTVEFDYGQSEPSLELPLPNGYVVSWLSFYDWRACYELEKRVTPADIQRYESVALPLSLVMRVPMWISTKASGVQTGSMVVRTASDGQVVAIADYSARLRPGGVNRIDLLVDPTHPQLAPYLLQHLICITQRLSLGRQIAFTVPSWQEAVIAAANAAGCVKRLEYCRMGVVL
jgi:ribosomal protein S18 acetylase RimI-like enzyme